MATRNKSISIPSMPTLENIEGDKGASGGGRTTRTTRSSSSSSKTNASKINSASSTKSPKSACLGDDAVPRMVPSTPNRVSKYDLTHPITSHVVSSASALLLPCMSSALTQCRPKSLKHLCMALLFATILFGNTFSCHRSNFAIATFGSSQYGISYDGMGISVSATGYTDHTTGSPTSLENLLGADGMEELENLLGGDGKELNAKLSDKPSKVTRKKPWKGKSVLYFAKLDLPEDLILWIKERNFELGRKLNATKIGCSEDWGHFLVKMQHLQTFISFARIKYTAIVHHHDSYDTEQAMHFVVMDFHIAGEWFDLGRSWKNRLINKFRPNCQIFNHHSNRPALIAVGAEEGIGNVYMAWYDWIAAERAVIDSMLHLPLGHNWNTIAHDMLATKIGSTGDLPTRLYEFTWASCFADIEYVAFLHPQMRDEEQDLHQTNHQSWIGYGEWFYFSTQQRNSIEQRYIIRPRTAGVKVRLQDRTFGYRVDVTRWRHVLQLVTIHDIWNNIVLGRISWTYLFT